MNGLTQGIYSLCDALIPVATAVLVASLVVLGIMTIINGSEGRVRFKEQVVYIILGAAVVFCAVGLGKTISGWFIG